MVAIALLLFIWFCMANKFFDLGYFGGFADAVLMLSILTGLLGSCFLKISPRQVAAHQEGAYVFNRQGIDTENGVQRPATSTGEQTPRRASPWRYARRTIAALVIAFVLTRAVVSGRGFASTDWLLLLVAGIVAEAEDIWRAVMRLFRGRSAGTRAPTADEQSDAVAWDAPSKVQRRVSAAVTLFAPTAFLLLLFLRDVWERDTGWLPSDGLAIALRVILGAGISAGAWRFRRKW